MTAGPGGHLVFYTDAIARGGAEQELGLLIAGLADEYRVTVIGVDPTVTAWLAGKRRGTVAVVVPPVRHKADVARMWSHRRCFRRLAPDILQANLNTLHSCQYAVLAALTLPGVVVVALEHSPLAHGSRASLWLKRVMDRRLGAHVAVGQEMARTIERLAHLRPGSVRTIHNAVPDAAVRGRPTTSGRSVVGSIGRLEYLKGYDVLLRAAASIDVDVVIVGEGPARAELVALADRLGMADRLRLPGWQDDPRATLAGMDIFALPSRLEGLPLVVLEAMLAELPVVATRVGSIGEAVDPTTGQLVAMDDAEAMGAAIQKLLDDPALARRQGEAGRTKALRDFSPARMIADWERLYAELAPMPPSLNP